MKVVVLGATGGVGREAVAQAASAGHEVTAFVRDPAKLEAPDGVRVAVGDALDADAVRSALAGQDAVLVCLNTHAGLAPSDELTRMAAVVSAAMPAEGSAGSSSARRPASTRSSPAPAARSSRSCCGTRSRTTPARSATIARAASTSPSPAPWD